MTRPDLRWWEWLLAGLLIGDVWRERRDRRRAARYTRATMRRFHGQSSALGRATAAAGRGLDQAVGAVPLGRVR